MESTIHVVKKSATPPISSSRRKLKLTSEHPDHYLVRKHRVAEIANCNLENIKIKGRNLGGLRT